MTNHLQIANLFLLYMIFSVPASILNFGTRQRAKFVYEYAYIQDGKASEKLQTLFYN